MTPAESTIIFLSLKVALVATLASVPLAIVVALVLARVRVWGVGALNALVHLPLVLPPVITGFALLRLFGRRGPVGVFLEDSLGLVLAFRWTGAALAAGVMGFPLMVRAIRQGIESVDHGLEDAAASLGASPVRVLATVTLPLALPGVLAGMILSFAKALGEFGATITFVSNIPGETQTLALAVFNLVQSPGGDAAAMRLVWVSVGISVVALLASEALARRVTRHKR